MDMEWMKLVVMAISCAFNVITLIYVVISNKNKVTNDRIGKLEDDIDSKFGIQGERIARIETISDKAPNHNDISKMYDSLNDLAKTVNQLVGENRGQSDTLKLILNQITAKGMK